ncbi:terminase small subunit [Pseudomonas sp. Sample_9]|jgi:hypothetical protein|uniref:terminase small subunit n=1 Tax=Pseudomonas sp. Sample_9 TaxID=2382158 RepID=UPI0010328316|nr:terminase small subunit [Pseudomonas sp. Sample_9]
MTEPLYLSKSAFAARIGKAPSTITWLKDNGRLVMAPDGKRVDVYATETLIKQTADPSKAGVVARHERERFVKDGPSVSIPEVPPPILQAALHPSVPGAEALPDFQKARARKEHFASLSVEADFYKDQGVLVESAVVDRAAFDTGRLLRDLLMTMPTQIAPELAAMTDSWMVEKHLLAALRRTLEDAERMSSADLQRALSNTGNKP